LGVRGLRPTYTLSIGSFGERLGFIPDHSLFKVVGVMPWATAHFVPAFDSCADFASNTGHVAVIIECTASARATCTQPYVCAEHRALRVVASRQTDAALKREATEAEARRLRTRRLTASSTTRARRWDAQQHAAVHLLQTRWRRRASRIRYVPRANVTRGRGSEHLRPLVAPRLARRWMRVLTAHFCHSGSF
jgi:hypothetical protein